MNAIDDKTTATAARSDLIVFALLAVSMVATRYHHFGSALHLADTSWAVFFLAGLFVRQRWALPALLLLASGVDIAALQLDGSLVGSCLTAAYPGLLLAYAGLWGAGRLARREGSAAYASAHGLIATAGWLVLGVAAAFAISNLTYWAWSGSFGAMSLGEYSGRVMHYFAGYLTTAVGYAALALVTASMIHLLRRSRHDGASERHHHA